MAVQIAQWKSNDGTIFGTQEAAEERDRLIEAVKQAMLPMGERIDDCSFTNGSGYIQHTPEAIREARLALHEVAKGPLGWWFDGQKKNHGSTDEHLALQCSPSYQMRMLDGGHAPLSNAYMRIYCLDGQSREWGQPYYASHPNEAKQVRIR